MHDYLFSMEEIEKVKIAHMVVLDIDAHVPTDIFEILLTYELV